MQAKTLNVNPPRLPKRKGSKPDSSAYLSESTSGFYLAGNHAKMVWQGNKSLIVKPVNYRNIVDKVFYIIGGNDCYGALKITSKKEIGLADFKKMGERHRITEKEAKEWFAGKKVLYAYEFEVLKKFELPARVSIPSGTKTLIDKVEFLKESGELEPCKGFVPMKPAKEFCNEEKMLDYLFGDA